MRNWILSIFLAAALTACNNQSADDLDPQTPVNLSTAPPPETLTPTPTPTPTPDSQSGSPTPEVSPDLTPGDAD